MDSSVNINRYNRSGGSLVMIVVMVSDTTVSFKLSDEEIDDTKLSIAKALKGVIQFDQLDL